MTRDVPMHLLAGHPYLLSALLGVPGVLIAIAMAGRHRGSVLLAGLVNVLFMRSPWRVSTRHTGRRNASAA